MKRELNFAIYLSHSIYNGLVEAFGIYLFRHTLRCMSKDVLHNIHRDITTIKKQSGSGMTGPVRAHGFVNTRILSHHLQVLVIFHITYNRKVVIVLLQDGKSWFQKWDGKGLARLCART